METLLALLGTTAGKAIAALTVAASAGGLHAADVIDIPVLPEEAQEEEELEVDAGDAEDDGDVEAELESDEDESEAEDEAELEAETDVTGDDEGAEEGEGKGVDGQSVAADARGEDGTPGVDGMAVRQEAIAGTPAEGKAPENPGEQGQERPAAAPVPDQAGDDADPEAEQDLEEEQDLDQEDDGEGAPAPQATEGQANRP